jgi:hypothetical protein
MLRFIILVAATLSAISTGVLAKRRTFTNTENGQMAMVTAAVECLGCSFGNLDLSHGAFHAIVQEREGRVPMSWHFN